MPDEPLSLDTFLTEDERAARQLRASKRELSQAQRVIEDLEAKVDLLTSVDAIRANPTAPKWLTKPTRGTKHYGIANLLLSDLHLDEVVDPDEVSGVNAYNRAIARQRLDRTFERFVMVARDYLNGVTYQGACVMLGGDIFSGNIHEELKMTNESSVIASVEYWLDPMVANLRAVADEFGHLHIPCVVGNHGRNTRKPIAKGRVEDNFDWLFYRLLAREFRGDKRVTFHIPTSADCTFKQNNTTYLLTHGDQFRGGSGISGLLAPLMTGDFRKRKRQSAVNDPYDYMVMGHWHQLSYFRNIIVNGAMKGYDEYASIGNFDYEPAQQAFWVNTPEHKVTFTAPVLSSKRSEEGW